MMLSWWISPFCQFIGYNMLSMRRPFRRVRRLWKYLKGLLLQFLDVLIFGLAIANIAFLPTKLTTSEGNN